DRAVARNARAASQNTALFIGGSALHAARKQFDAALFARSPSSAAGGEKDAVARQKAQQGFPLRPLQCAGLRSRTYGDLCHAAPEVSRSTPCKLLRRWRRPAYRRRRRSRRQTPASRARRPPSL